MHLSNFIRIFAIITNIYQYEKYISVRVESLCGRIQEHDVGKNPMVVDSPESSDSLPGAAAFLLPACAGRKDGGTENGTCG